MHCHEEAIHRFPMMMPIPFLEICHQLFPFKYSFALICISLNYYDALKEIYKYGLHLKANIIPNMTALW